MQKTSCRAGLVPEKVCAAHFGGRLAENSLNRDSFFGKFSFSVCQFGRTRQKLPKIDSFSPKFIMKASKEANFGS